MIDRVTADWKKLFDWSDLLYTYDLKQKDCIRYTLVTKSKMTNLTTGLGVNDRGWQSRLFFVNKESLGEVGDFLVEEWTWEGKNLSYFVFYCYFTERHLTLSCFAVLDVSLVDLNVDSQEKTVKFLKYSGSERKFLRDVSHSEDLEGTGDAKEEI